MLLKFGADPQANKRDGTGCLHVVVSQDESDAALDMLDFLLTVCKCPMTGADKYGSSPYARYLSRLLTRSRLHHACRKEQIKIVQMLLEHGFPVNLTDADGLTPLHNLCSTWKNKEDLTGKEGEKLVALYKVMIYCLSHVSRVDLRPPFGKAGIISLFFRIFIFSGVTGVRSEFVR